MSLGTWNPDADAASKHIQIDADTLARLMGISRANQLDDLERLIQGDECQQLAGLMQVDHGAWLAAAEPLPDADLLDLIRFFAMAENLPGWEAGPRSPVIPLARTLRKRGNRLDRELLKWLREVNDNRFLPYGPL